MIQRLTCGLWFGVLAAVLSHASAATPPSRLAWLQDDAPVTVERPLSSPIEPSREAWRTPLGSVWKLFVYSYLSSRNSQEPVYRCEATRRQPDEDYCCDPGDSVTRDQALERSCGAYFNPKRLAINADEWARFWRANQAPTWLTRLSAMQPATDIPVDELLRGLRQIPGPARVAARQALLPISTRDEAILAALGSGPRFKTWSWFLGQERWGGAAGWLADGTPFWFGSAGTSRIALRAQAPWIASQWPSENRAIDTAVAHAAPCVDVNFFQRYPIRSVLRGDDTPAPLGPMNGRYRVLFQNGTQLVIHAVPALQLRRSVDGLAIDARLPLEDYVARVVDREGRGNETEAARALAVAARTYVLQNAPELEACRQIADDSRTQRVSANPPSAAARAAAAFTQDLVVSGVPVRYHSSQAAPGVLSWQAAVQASRRGTGFEAILRNAYPGGTLGGSQRASDCTPLPQAQQWLAQRQTRWRAVLQSEPGYQPLDSSLRVCQLAIGTPHSDQRRQLIRVREWQSREGRVTLIHEYLHLAFRHHPKGQDEVFIEQLAQRLADS